MVKRGEERFVKVYSQGISNVAEIYVDRETGVNYLLAASSKAFGGLSVMLDADGKPVVTPAEDLN